MSKAPSDLEFGAFRITPLLDGYAWMPNAIFPAFDPVDTGAAQDGSFRTAIWAFLIRAKGFTLLVDSGSAGNFGPEAGRFRESLAASAVRPEDIDTLFLTHLHSDHYGGLLGAEGQAAFPNARLVMSELEWQSAHDPVEQAARSAEDQAVTERARQTVAPYAARTERVGDGSELAPGLRVVELPGHTSGHSGLLLSDGGRSALILGDVVHHAAYQMPNPDWSVIYDDDQSQAAETRKAVLIRAARDRSLILGAHLDGPGFSRVETAGQGFRLIPVPGGA